MFYLVPFYLLQSPRPNRLEQAAIARAEYESTPHYENKKGERGALSMPNQKLPFFDTCCAARHNLDDLKALILRDGL
jgi:hypothetical protein